MLAFIPHVFSYMGICSGMSLYMRLWISYIALMLFRVPHVFSCMGICSGMSLYMRLGINYIAWIGQWRVVFGMPVPYVVIRGIGVMSSSLICLSPCDWVFLVQIPLGILFLSRHSVINLRWFLTFDSLVASLRISLNTGKAGSGTILYSSRVFLFSPLVGLEATAGTRVGVANNSLYTCAASRGCWAINHWGSAGGGW